MATEISNFTSALQNSSKQSLLEHMGVRQVGNHSSASVNIHSFHEALDIVQEVAVGEHDSLSVSSSTGGVAHEHDTVLVGETIQGSTALLSSVHSVLKTDILDTSSLTGFLVISLGTIGSSVIVVDYVLEAVDLAGLFQDKELVDVLVFTVHGAHLSLVDDVANSVVVHGVVEASDGGVRVPRGDLAGGPLISVLGPDSEDSQSLITTLLRLSETIVFSVSSKSLSLIVNCFPALVLVISVGRGSLIVNTSNNPGS